MSSLYDFPTVDQFLETYPEFVDADPCRIEKALVQAGRRVDETWIAEDYQPAIMAYAAHLMACSAAAAGTFGQDDLRSISIGPLSLSYGDKVSFGTWESTPYGQQYFDLLRLNQPAVAVV